MRKFSNFSVFLVSNSLLSFAIGFYGPFWIIFIQKFGQSIGQFGFAIGLMGLAQAITSYLGGFYSDKIGRKAFLIMSGFLLTGSIFSYTLISSLSHLYALQIIHGITTSLQMTMENIVLGDLTKKVSRGVKIGQYHAIVGGIASLAMMGSGFLVEEVGFKIIFYVTAFIVFCSTFLLLVFYEEPRHEAEKENQ